jgi:cation diffusion facilitator family transporter
VSTGGGKKAIIAALVANLGIAGAKFVGFLLTGASSLLAEAVHSLADTTNQGLLLLGGRQAKRGENELHPFGYGPARYFWSFVVALVLFTLGGLFALYEGIHKIRHPEPLDRPAIAIVLLLVAVGLEGFSFKTAISEAKPLKGNQSWFAYIRDSKSPELPVLLLEDFGALMGLGLALGAIVMSLVTDNPKWDGYGTLAIGALLLVIAAILITEMRKLLIGEAASPEDISKITTAFNEVPDVERLIHMRTLHLGPEELLIAAKVQLNPGLDVEGVARAIDEAQVIIRASLPIATRIYIEPAIFDPGRASLSQLPGSQPPTTPLR